jgi:hypothetical protein
MIIQRKRFSLAGVCALCAIISLGVPALAQYTGTQGVDMTVIQGVNTAGTIRVNNLGCLEALINIIANGTQVVGIIWASVILVTVRRCMKNSSRKAKVRLVIGLVVLAIALSTPAMFNWLVASARDANLFS